MKFYEFLVLTTKNDELFNYLCAKNVIRKKIKCPRCKNVAELKGGQPLVIHCLHSYYKKTQKHKRKRITCNFKISALNGTWFSQGLLSINVVCRLICYVMMMNSPRQIFLQKELDISSHTAVDWVNFCREVINLHNLIILY
jgi:phage FluMu protein Com